MVIGRRFRQIKRDAGAREVLAKFSKIQLLAIERAVRKKDILVVGVEAIGDALQAVKEGRLDATVFQDSEGQAKQALRAAVALSRKETAEKQTFIPFQLVTGENVGEFLH